LFYRISEENFRENLKESSKKLTIFVVSSQARAAGSWIFGEYCELIDKVDVILHPFLSTFPDEPPIVATSISPIPLPLRAMLLWICSSLFCMPLALLRYFAGVWR
jgi:hypothetical protein